MSRLQLNPNPIMLPQVLQQPKLTKMRYFHCIFNCHGEKLCNRCPNFFSMNEELIISKDKSFSTSVQKVIGFQEYSVLESIHYKIDLSASVFFSPLGLWVKWDFFYDFQIPWVYGNKSLFRSDCFALKLVKLL